MVARTRTRFVAVAVTGLVTALALTGCSNPSDDERKAEASPTASSSATTTTPSPSPSTSPSPSPVVSTTAAPSLSPTVVPSRRPLPLRDRLLTADEMPGFNEQFHWRPGPTRAREGDVPFGTCSDYVMTSIGATRVVVRRHLPPASGGQESAGQLVAEFPDETTARRAYEVLKSWRGRCADNLRAHDKHEIGSLEPVPVQAGASGGWYLLIYGPPRSDPDSAYFDAQGLALVGRQVSVLEMRVVGQDYNYPAGKEPMVEAVRRAAEKLG